LKINEIIHRLKTLRQYNSNHYYHKVLLHVSEKRLDHEKERVLLVTVVLIPVLSDFVLL